MLIYPSPEWSLPWTLSDCLSSLHLVLHLGVYLILSFWIYPSVGLFYLILSFYFYVLSRSVSFLNLGEMALYRRHPMEPGASQVVPVAKNPPANEGDAGDMGSIPGLGRSLGEGNGNPLQYSFLGNPMGRGAWWATVHGVTESDRRKLRLMGTSRTLPSGHQNHML